jgi:SAM-dependent methyltransferase
MPDVAPPAPPSPLATPDAWDLVSDGYVTEIVPTFERYADDALRLAGVRPGDRVVDVACGPGTLSFLAVAMGARVDAIDFSERMIRALHERQAREGVDAIHARIGDGQALPYADATFAAGFSMFGLIFFPDRAKGLSELARVVVPGGRVVVASWQPMDRVPLLTELFAALRAALPGLPFGGAKAPLGEADEVRAEMGAAGLRDVAVQAVSHASDAPSMDAFWASTEKSLAPLVLLRNRLGEGAYASVAERVRAHLGRTFGEGPQRLEMVANLGVGTR